MTARRAVCQASRLRGSLLDVRVLTYELTQCRRVGGVVVVEVDRSVQHHQHDQTLLAFLNHVVVVSHVELIRAVTAETQ